MGYRRRVAGPSRQAGSFKIEAILSTTFFFSAEPRLTDSPSTTPFLHPHTVKLIILFSLHAEKKKEFNLASQMKRADLM